MEQQGEEGKRKMEEAPIGDAAAGEAQKAKRKRKRKHAGSKAKATAANLTADGTPEASSPPAGGGEGGKATPPKPTAAAATSSTSKSAPKSPKSSSSSSSSVNFEKSSSSSMKAGKRGKNEHEGKEKDKPDVKRQRTDVQEEEASSANGMDEQQKVEKPPVQIDDDNLEVTVEGAQIAPIAAFADCQAFNAHNGALLKNIAKNDYKKPTAVQRHAIPILLAGRDFMGCAQTGSGKTAAFLLPIIASLLNEDKRKGEPPGVGWRTTYRAYPLVIILAPTRELAIQIYQEGLKFAEGTPVKVAMVYGGTSYVAQARLMEKNCSDILVATPGRLKDMIERDKISLRQVCCLVLDEADRMLDMGFEPDIRDLVEKRDMPKERHTMMFSATFPTAIKKLATDFLKKDFVRLTVGREGATTATIIQVVKQVHSEKQKWNMLVEELQKVKDEQALVFVELKQQVGEVGEYLKRSGFSVAMFHGDLEQRERELALKSFRKKVARVMVATNVAGRGLDIEAVNHVINFEMPKNIESYVHRVGRTGRAGHTGVATSFFNPRTDRNRAGDLVKVLKESNQEIPDWLQSLASEPKNKKQRSKEKFHAVRKQRRQMYKQQNA